MATGNNVNHISVLPVYVVTENLVRQAYAKFFYQPLRSSADRPALGEFNADTSSALVIVNRPRSAQQQLIYNSALCSVTAASAQIERSQPGSLFVSGSVTQLCGITRDFTFRSSSSAPYLKQNHHSTVTPVVTDSTIRSQFLPLAQTKSAAVIIEQESTTTNIGLSRISTTKMASDRLIGFDSPQTVYDDKNAIQFNGSNQYLTTPTAPFAFGSANFTVEAFVYLNAMPTSDAWPTAYASHMVLATVGTVNLVDGIGFIIGATKLIVQNNDTQYASTPHGMAPNTVYHIAFVRNGNNVSFYVNGEAKGSVAFNVSAGTGASGWIGSETGQGAFFNGKISNLRIVHNTAVYTAAFAMPQGQLTNIANTALLTCRSTTFIDLSNNAYTITAVNSPTITTVGVYLPGAFSVTLVAILGLNGYGVGTVSVPVSLNDNRIEIIGAGPLQVGSYKMTQRYTTVITQSNNATRATSDHVANEFTEPVFVYVLTPPSVRAAYQFVASPDKNGIAATVDTQTVTVSSAYTRSSLPPNAFSITYGNRALTRHNVSITQVNCSVLGQKRSPDVIEKLVVVNDLASIKATLIFVNTGANAGASTSATAAPYGTAAVFVPGDGQLAVGSNSEFWY